MEENDEQAPGNKKGKGKLHEILPGLEDPRSQVINGGSTMRDSENQFDESMAIQGKFSFMALLNGELDMNYSSSATHIQGQAHLEAERTSGTSTHQHGQKNTEHEEPEDIPWETSFFNDMQLDEVVHEDDQGEGDKQDFDHTWNLDRSNDNNG